MPTIQLVNPKDSSASPEPQSFPAGSRLADVVATFVTEKTKKKKRPIAAVLDGKVVGLDTLLPEEEEPTIEFLLPGDPRALGQKQARHQRHPGFGRGGDLLLWATPGAPQLRQHSLTPNMLKPENNSFGQRFMKLWIEES